MKPSVLVWTIEAIHPDEFIAGLIQTNKDLVLTALRNTRARLKNPARTAKEHFERLKIQGLVQSMTLLEQDVESI